MSLNVIATIITCLQLFKDNWQRANESRGVLDAIVLKGMYGLTQFVEAIAQVQAILMQQGLVLAALRQAYKQRDAYKASLHNIITRFHYRVRFLLDPVEQARLPKIPNPMAKQLDFFRACEMVRDLWQSLLDNPNPELPEPLVIDGYTLEEFTTEVVALTAAYETIVTKSKDNTILCQTRDQLVYKEIKPRIIEYRAQIIALFQKGDSVRVNLPLISDPRGARPDSVELLGTWDETAQTAVLTWTPSARTNLLHYEVRACLDNSYRSQDEYHVATVAKDKLTWNTNEGLSAPGSTIHYKVYVVTQTHRERGSNPAKVTRPASVPLENAA